MRKKLLIILIAVAIPLYVWDVWLVVRGTVSGGGRPGIKQEEIIQKAETEIAFASLQIVRYTNKGKSPFLAYKEKPKPVVKQAPVMKKVVSKPKKEAKPPRIKITGIMWSPSNPVAMITLPDGSSTVAKAGQTLPGDITVKKVEKSRIQIVYKGRGFWIKK